MLFSAGGKPEIVRFAEEVARKLRFTGHRAFDFTPPRGTCTCWSAIPAPRRDAPAVAKGADGFLFVGGAGETVRAGGPKMIGCAMPLRPFERGIWGLRRWGADFARAQAVLFEPLSWVPFYHLAFLKPSAPAGPGAAVSRMRPPRHRMGW